LSAPAARNSNSAALIMVNVLPLPCVCQTRPRRASGLGGADRLGGGEDHLGDEQFRRLPVVAADLIDPQRDRLVLRRVLALDDQHGDAVDEEDHVLAHAVLAVVAGKLLGHLGDEGPRRFGVLRIQLPHLRLEQVVEKRRCRSRLLGGRVPGAVEASSLLGFPLRHELPADLLGIGEDSGLNGLVFTRCGGHVILPTALEARRVSEGAVYRTGTGYPLADASGSHPLAHASGSHPLAHASGSHPLAHASGSRPLAHASGSRPLAHASGSRPLAHASGSPGALCRESRRHLSVTA
jgi:hypothetical protein